MIEAGIAALAGLLLGSFLNVCIYRWPRDLSVVWPGSHCIECNHAIGWYDNVPLLSYALLGGRCRHCLARIHWRYPVIEALTAGLFATGVVIYGPTLAALKFAVFVFLQLGMIFSDLETRLLPDQFTKGGIVLGFLFAAIVPVQGIISFFLPVKPLAGSLLDAGFATVLVSGAMWGIGVVYAKVRHKEGLGFGDVKMVAMMGAFLGIAPAVMAVFAACLLGTVVGLGFIFLAKKDAATYELPFGAFLGVGAIVVAVMGR